MWLDQETRTDLFNYAGIAKTIARLIQEPHMSPLTIGIHGDWGSGKSSVMNMVMDQLVGDQYLKVAFNGWAFEGFEDAKLALMETLLHELGKNKKIVDTAKDELVSLARRLNYLKVLRKAASLALTLHGLPIDLEHFLPAKKHENVQGDKVEVNVSSEEPWLRAATDDTPEHIHGFRDALEGAINKASIQRLVVFIDDLDRCLPETAIATLEAIKLFLAVPNTTFVICADDKFIEYAVKSHFPGIPPSSGPGTIEDNYLEKLIQIPFHLPRMNRVEVRRYVSLLLLEGALRSAPKTFDALLKAVLEATKTPWQQVDLRHIIQNEDFAGHRATLNEQLDLAAQISAPLENIAKGNPRQIKRFLNTLSLRRRVAEAFGLDKQINDAAMAKLMLIERFAPEIYEEITRVAASRPDGKVPFIATLETADFESDGQKAFENPDIPRFDLDQSRLDWVIRWFTSPLKLGELDLRPYLFVSREKPTDFLTGETLDAALSELANLLMEADPFAAAALSPRLNALTHPERTTLTRIIWDSIAFGGKLDKRPEELRNLHLVLADAADAQDYMLQRFEQLEELAVKPWMPSFVQRLIKSSAHATRLRALFLRWRKIGNDELAAAVDFLTGSR